MKSSLEHAALKPNNAPFAAQSLTASLLAVSACQLERTQRKAIIDKPNVPRDWVYG